MIDRARDRWFASDGCTVGGLVDYIVQAGQMRDAQVEAIKTYLFLKIACGNRPLASIVASGALNSIDLNDIELTSTTRDYLAATPAAAALLEYSMLIDEAGEQASLRLERAIKEGPDAIDCGRFISDALYGVAYTDYLFSLPMGAGKTYLMAAFIYLDLYFALNEPDNPAFAHNFIIFAPSGLKSSVVPSLRTIQRFDPTWVIPEPSASDVRRRMAFEVLDLAKAARRSNKARNPNAQRIAGYQPFPDLFGLVAVTNAEKVILDRMHEKDGQVSFNIGSDDERDRAANELRNLIGKLPSLSVFIDEVHHAVSDEIKLRAIVNRWTAENRSFNSVVGFTGTPYLEKAERHEVVQGLQVATAEIANTVFYYPLVNGIGNFLKRPVVRVSDAADSAHIIEAGVREFLETYRDTVYDGGLAAKLGIYCGTIERLEQTVYPLALRLAAEYGLPPGAILRFHRGNRQHPAPQDSQMQFDMLDQPLSAVRIVLLVQIGKEGWDCRSLTGVILSQEGDCPKNMVLQASCRCLRQVVRGSPETALIHMNEGNAAKLNDQLGQQHRITLKEFQSGAGEKDRLRRYDRTAHLGLPPMRFYQLRVSHEALTLEVADPQMSIPLATGGAAVKAATIRTQDFSRAVTGIAVDDAERGAGPAVFLSWLYGIAKAGFGLVSMQQLRMQASLLREVFDAITFEQGGMRRFSSRYDRRLVEANIRKAFHDRRSLTTVEELIPQEARLLSIASLTPTVATDRPQDYYPSQPVVEGIIADDKGELAIDGKTAQLIKLADEAGQPEIAERLRRDHMPHPAKDRSFHYLPYKTDSAFEQTFLEQVLAMDDLAGLGLEVYYNGDRALTEFRIACYRQRGGTWLYIGQYTPDFLIIRRQGGDIHQAVIVETKGAIYANDPTFGEKREFMETWKGMNNESFGYERFAYLYLEDSLSEADRITRTHEAIMSFFMEVGTNA
jgi:hypothetical protein